MRYTIFTLLTVIMLFSVGQTSNLQTNKSNAAEQEVRKLERAWLDAYEQHDAKAMNAIVADDFVITFPDGTRQTKPQIMDSIKRPRNPANHLKLYTEEVQARVYGDTVILNGRVVTEYQRDDGKPVKEQSRYTDTYIRRNGRWQVVVSHLSNVAEPQNQNSSVSSNSANYGQIDSQAIAKDKKVLESQVDAYVKPYLDIGGFNGTVLIAKKGKILLSKGYGMANYELNIPNTPQTKFHLASVSKTFTAAAIMLLQERGLLNVSDPLTKFIPDYPNGNRITVHHLLTNTSGIPSINNFPEYDEWSKFPHTPEDLIEKFKNKPLDFNPGERGYTESNGNYNLLAYIIEKLSGKSYGEFLEENIFTPLGLKDTGHDGRPEVILKNRANGYVPTGVSELKNAPYLDWSIKIGNGSIYSTVEDLYKWDRSLYTEKILKKATIEKMFAEGYGWFAGERLNRNAVWMNGRSPGFQSEIQRYADNDVCIIVLGNNYAPTASLIAEGLAAITLGEKYEIPKLAKPVKLDPKVFDAYVGRYQFGSDFFVPGGIYTIEKRNDRLFMTTRVVNDTLTPQSETEFFDRTFWATIIFVKNDKGEVTNLIWRYGGRDYKANKL